MGFKTSICLCETQVMNDYCAELGSAEHWGTSADAFISSTARGTPGETNPFLGDSSAEMFSANPSATEV